MDARGFASGHHGGDDMPHGGAAVAISPSVSGGRATAFVPRLDGYPARVSGLLPGADDRRRPWPAAQYDSGNLRRYLSFVRRYGSRFTAIAAQLLRWDPHALDNRRYTGLQS